ncbi:hypothetical protein M9458_052445 [Cirrhinus mrigala]|uniref:Uncharacterized protein n=1 Tax=Cirrhinus mrigala TaxID=683832 RepID=A0ABD0MU93_CIRMR
MAGRMWQQVWLVELCTLWQFRKPTKPSCSRTKARVSPLRRLKSFVADLAHRTTKQTAAVIGRSMAAMVATERHLLVNLAVIRKKEKDCLLYLLSPTGQIGTFVEAVVDKFKKPRTQSAAPRNLIPHRPKFTSRGEICLKPRLTDESKSPALLTVPLLPLGVAEERLVLIKGYRISGMC